MKSFIYLPSTSTQPLDKKTMKFFDYGILSNSIKVKGSGFLSGGLFASKNTGISDESLQNLRTYDHPIVGMITDQGGIDWLIECNGAEDLLTQLKEKRDLLEIQVIQSALQLSNVFAALQLQLKSATRLSLESLKDNEVLLQNIFQENINLCNLFTELPTKLNTVRLSFNRNYSIIDDNYDLNSLFVYCSQLKVIMNWLNHINTNFSETNIEAFHANFFHAFYFSNQQNSAYLKEVADWHYSSKQRTVEIVGILGSMLMLGGFIACLVLSQLGIGLPFVLYVAPVLVAVAILGVGITALTSYYLGYKKEQAKLPIMQDIADIVKNLVTTMTAFQGTLGELKVNTSDRSVNGQDAVRAETASNLEDFAKDHFETTSITPIPSSG